MAIGEKSIIASNLPESAAHRKKLDIPELNCRKWKWVGTMIERKVSIAEIMLIAGTRVALGVGIGLLISGRLNRDQRNAAGLALALVGGLTTIPLAIGVIGKRSATTQIRPAA
jgi:hypothetical protein